eukprot:1158301-Pelagomonas_calceolata.AAC.7
MHEGRPGPGLATIITLMKRHCSGCNGRPLWSLYDCYRALSGCIHSARGDLRVPSSNPGPLRQKQVVSHKVLGTNHPRWVAGDALCPSA